MDDINTIRKKAASSALQDLAQAFQRVKDRYDRKHQLRTVLHQPRPIQSISQLANHLKTIRNNAMQAHASLVAGGKLDDRIEIPIQWAEQQLEQLEKIITEARELALDSRAFEIDKLTLDTGAASLFSAGDDRLNERSDALVSLGKVWAEAFELAGGMCLRHEGLDDGLCQIAEALIEEINWVKGKAFAIPSRSAVGVLPNVIHLPFPEWTIWALPLTAQEVWHLRLRGREAGKPDKLLRAVLEDAKEKSSPDKFAELERSASSVWGDPDFQCCMGDVFGVFALGPAYACASIDLALDPTQNVSRQRALTMFHCLKSVDDELRPTLDVLQRQWQEAVNDRQAGDPQVPPVIEQETLRYEPWIKAVGDYLKTHASGFILDRWREQRGSLMDALRLSAGAEASKSIDPGRTKFRYLLSAAWKTRFEYPLEADQIAKRFKQLAEYLLNQGHGAID